MQAIRDLLARRHLAVLLCAATLLLKLLVPTGYMVAADHGRLTITVCPGMIPAPMPAMPAMHDDASGHAMHGEMPGHDGSGEHGKVEQPCAFAGLSAAVLGAIDPVLLAALVVFVLCMGLLGIALPMPRGPAYLRPPLRGPPA